MRKKTSIRKKKHSTRSKTQRISYKGRFGRGKNMRKQFGDDIKSGYDIKQLLVSLHNNPDKQEQLVYIIKDEDDVREKLFEHLTNQIHTFSWYTLNKLQTPISQLQELAVPDAWKFQSYINVNLENGLSNVPIGQFTAQGYKSRSRYSRSYRRRSQ